MQFLMRTDVFLPLILESCVCSISLVLYIFLQVPLSVPMEVEKGLRRVVVYGSIGVSTHSRFRHYSRGYPFSRGHTVFS